MKHSLQGGPSNYFSDSQDVSQDDQPDRRAGKKIPKNAKEFKKRLRQKHSDLHFREDEYGIPDRWDRDSYDREFEVVEDLIADEIPIKEDIESEKQAVEIFKESMKNRNEKGRKKEKVKGKVEKQGEGRDCGTPCPSTSPITNRGSQNTIHQIFPNLPHCQFRWNSPAIRRLRWRYHPRF